MENSRYSYICFISDILEKYYHFSREVADFVGCQFALESTFGTSKLAVENNNHCGMKLPLSRITTAKNYRSGQTFASYDSFEQCLYDYLLLLQYRQPTSDVREKLGCFKYFLKKICYCPEKDYIRRIESIYNQFINSKN